MAYFTGLLSGFAGRKAEIEQENLRRAELAADREARVYETLLSSPDPEIQSLAAAGLLSSAQPRKRAGGLRGWLGEMEASPHLAQIQELIRTPVTEERVTPGLPSRTLRQQIPMQAPSVAPAALPDQSTVEPGAAPPTTPVATPPPFVFEERAGPAVGRVDRVTRPRQVFATPAQRAREETLARQTAEYDAERAFMESIGIPPEEFGSLKRAEVLSRLRPQRNVQEGNIRQLPSGEWVQDLYDPVTARVIGQIPAAPPTRATGATSEFDEAIAAYEQKIGRPLTYEERLKVRQDLSAAGRAPTAGGGDTPDALAEMAAQNPTVLQGLTPTLSGAVRGAIAKNPQLRQRYEQARMAPVREQAQLMLTAINKLLTTDDTGKTQLSPGAQAVFGEYTPTSLRGIFPGAAGPAAAADANAALKQVIGQQIVDLIAEMKRQSQTGATGFGQLNLQELDVLTSASTQLKQRLSEGAALEQLTALRDKFNKVLLPGSGEPGGPSTSTGLDAIIPGLHVDEQGNFIRR